MAVARPTGELQNQSLNEVDLTELRLSVEEQTQTVLSQTSGTRADSRPESRRQRWAEPASLWALPPA